MKSLNQSTFKKKISFELLFLRKNKKGSIESYCFDCAYTESPGMTEFYNDLINSILEEYDSCHIRNIRTVQEWKEILKKS